MWAINYFTHEKFDLPQLSKFVNAGTNIAISVGDYFTNMFRPNYELERCRRNK